MSIGSIILASFVVGPGSVFLASLVLRLPEDTLKRLTPRVLSFAVGALLAMALLRMLPHALAHGATMPVLQTALVAILLLFLAERFQVLRHCHEFHCQEHADLPLRIFLGNASHALVDGIALALAFQAGSMAGWVFTLALVAHEVPKSIVSLVLLKEGRNNAVALLWNLIPSFFTQVGALAAGISIAFVKPITPYGLGAGAAFFLYLALADLVPRHRRAAEKSEAVWQAALVAAGAALIWFLPAH